MIDVLAFAAHPDDVELSMGATMLKLKMQGFKTGIIDFTRGELSTKGTIELREKETNAATQIMQLDARENLHFDDGFFEATLEHRKTLIDIIRKYQPKLIFAPYMNDRHPDHERCSKMVREANFYAGLQKIESSYQAYRAKKIYYYMGNNEFDPSIVFDVSDTFKGKLDLIYAYNSQFYAENQEGKATHISRPEFLEFIQARARFYGEKAGVLYGEPFFTESIPLVTEFLELK